MSDLTSLVLLFHTTKAASTAARLHAFTCPMTQTASRTVQVIRTNVASHVADLEGRGYPVKRCKCCRPA